MAHKFKQGDTVFWYQRKMIKPKHWQAILNKGHFKEYVDSSQVTVTLPNDRGILGFAASYLLEIGDIASEPGKLSTQKQEIENYRFETESAAYYTDLSFEVAF